MQNTKLHPPSKIRLNANDTEESDDVFDWSGSHPIGTRRALATPETEAEVQEIVRGARTSVKVIGSRLSQIRLLSTDQTSDVILDLTRMSGLVSISSDSATFRAATPLDEVHRVLAAHGRMLPSSPGVIARQTLAGALATGTHGQGLKQSSIADEALSFRVIGADGTVRVIDRAHPWFGAAQLSLGSLGVVTEVTLRTVHAHTFTCLKRTVSAEDLESNFHHWNESYAICKAWWFLDDARAHVWLGREATSAEAGLYDAANGQIVPLTETNRSMNETVDRTLKHLRQDTFDDAEVGDQFKTVKRFRDFSDVTGDIYQLFCNGIPAPQVNLEIAIPQSKVEEAMQTIKRWHAKARPHMHYPIILRSTGPSSAWLSPANGQATCYFGFVVYYAADGSISSEGLKFLQEVQLMLAALGGRPHWGKHFAQDLFAWSAVYPEWNNFNEVRLQMDPTEKFSNRFVRRLFSPGLQ